MGLNGLTAIIAIFTMLAVVKIYWPIMSGAAAAQCPWLKRVSLGIVLMMLVVAARSLYWDVSQMLLNPEQWSLVRDRLGGQSFSTVFNVGVIVSCLVLVQARDLLGQK